MLGQGRTCVLKRGGKGGTHTEKSHFGKEIKLSARGRPFWAYAISNYGFHTHILIGIWFSFFYVYIFMRRLTKKCIYIPFNVKRSTVRFMRANAHSPFKFLIEITNWCQSPCPGSRPLLAAKRICPQKGEQQGATKDTQKGKRNKISRHCHGLLSRIRDMESESGHCKRLHSKKTSYICIYLFNILFRFTQRDLWHSQIRNSLILSTDFLNSKFLVFFFYLENFLKVKAYFGWWVKKYD